MVRKMLFFLQLYILNDLITVLTSMTFLILSVIALIIETLIKYKIGEYHRPIV